MYKFLVIIFSLLLCCGCSNNNITTVKSEGNRIVTIERYYSEMDQDGDGIDDQTDIIQTTYEYLATDPIYMSKYYGTGYPDDGYGVCTDVVAFSVLGAGYDLRQLVDDHVRANRHLYDIEDVDKNIDFRRVENMIIYLRENHIELTSDPMQIEQWQPGDIIVFSDHVGIVSDQRTIRGVPLIIHHTEKDPHIRIDNLLQTRDDIQGHFRMS